MPTVRDRPDVGSDPGAKTLERPVAPPLKKGERPRRPERYMRWMGWLVALAVLAVAATVTAVVLVDDEPAANLGATLELRLAKEAIEDHQQAAIASPEAAPQPAPAVPDLGATRLEQLLRKDAIDEANALLYQSPFAVGLAATLERRIAKEAIEDSQQR